MTRLTLFLLLAWSGCAVSIPDDTDDSGLDDTSADTGGDTGAEDTGEVPRDVDADGFTSDVDCDDYDPTVYPGAEESWDREDEDCDGTIDADGEYSGVTRVNARAVFEGTPYRFTLDCPTTLSRTGGRLGFEIRCTPDPGDDMAQRLLGAEVVLTPRENYVEAERWAGGVVVASSSGWDVDGTGAVTWTSFAAASVAIRLSTTYLSMDGAGDVTRGE